MISKKISYSAMEERTRGGYSDFKGKPVVREAAYWRWEVKVLCGE